MKPFTHTLKGLSELDVRYLVPLYQRPYVWSKKKHWEPLWDDITVVLEHHLNSDGSGSLSHFLGAIVLDQEHTPPGRAVERLVIDGQQRLTTLQLLLAAAAHCAAAAGADRDARVLSTLIRNNPDLESGDNQFKVWPTNANREAFRNAMQINPEGGATADDASNTIQEAKQFFIKAIDSWAREDDPSDEEAAKRYEALRVTLTDLLNVVSINLEPRDNAQVIFETLNARGTPLLALDLVKNAAFHRATREDLNVDDLHSEVWEPQLGDEYWRQNQRQGRLNRPRAELFLMHWLAMELGQIIPATELFTEFRTHMLDGVERPSMGALIPRLCEDAKVLRSFGAQPPGSVEEQFFRHLDALDTTTVIPIALLLYRSPEVDAKQRRRALQLIESWLVRRMLCGLTTRRYNYVAADLLSAAKKNLANADEAIRETLIASEVPTAIWPSDDALKTALTTRDLYGYISQKRVVMILSAIELKARRSNKVEEIYTLPEKLTVEHILPVKWKRHWPLPPGEPEELATTTRMQRLNQIGNLTLTSGPLNASLSNSAWTTKRKALAKNSLLLINRTLIEAEEWSDDQIAHRTLGLFKEIKTLWPGPESPKWL